jgi:DNA-binding winged helix-turn-helix (wHTH) protein
VRSQPADILSFSRFTICLSRREFLVDGTLLELGGRIYDVLIALIEAQGGVLSKNELMNRVWPGRIVEEGNLHACISRLRKIMGPDGKLIRTVSGRGYQFVGTVQETPASTGTAGNVACCSAKISQEELLVQLQKLMFERPQIGSWNAAGHGNGQSPVDLLRGMMAYASDRVWIVQIALIPG